MQEIERRRVSEDFDIRRAEFNNGGRCLAWRWMEADLELFVATHPLFLFLAEQTNPNDELFFFRSPCPTNPHFQN